LDLEKKMFSFGILLADLEK